MNTTEFNYAETFRRVLDKKLTCRLIDDTDGDIFLETNNICIGNFMITFNIMVSKDGLFQLRFYPAGTVPEKFLPKMMAACVKEVSSLQRLKVIIDKDNFLAVSCDALLPADEKLMEEELDDIMRLISFAYRKIMPRIMIDYWECVSLAEEND